MLSSSGLQAHLVLRSRSDQFPGSSPQVHAWERVAYVKLKSLIPSGIVRTLPWVSLSLTEDDNREEIEDAW